MLICVALGATSCGDDDDDSEGEPQGDTAEQAPDSEESSFDVTAIETALAEQLGGGGGGLSSLEDVTVECPDDVTAEAGAEFDCEADAVAGADTPEPGAPVTGSITVTLQDDTGEAFDYDGAVEGGGFSQELSGSSTVTSE
jgi:hypothetical protein